MSILGSVGKAFKHIANGIKKSFTTPLRVLGKAAHGIGDAFTKMWHSTVGRIFLIAVATYLTAGLAMYAAAGGAMSLGTALAPSTVMGFGGTAAGTEVAGAAGAEAGAGAGAAGAAGTAGGAAGGAGVAAGDAAATGAAGAATGAAADTAVATTAADAGATAGAFDAGTAAAPALGVGGGSGLTSAELTAANAGAGGAGAGGILGSAGHFLSTTGGGLIGAGILATGAQALMAANTPSAAEQYADELKANQRANNLGGLHLVNNNSQDFTLPGQNFSQAPGTGGISPQMMAPTANGGQGQQVPGQQPAQQSPSNINSLLMQAYNQQRGLS